MSDKREEILRKLKEQGKIHKDDYDRKIEEIRKENEQVNNQIDLYISDNPSLKAKLSILYF